MKMLKLKLRLKKYYCYKCDSLVKKETDPKLRKEYTFFCPECYENMYKFEVYNQ